MYKHRFILIVYLIVANTILHAQDLNRIFEYEQDAEYYMADKQFDKAAESYLKALKISPNSSNLKFKTGYCYLNTDDKKQLALKYLEEAAQDASPDFKASSLKETKAPVEALYFLAQLYQITFQFSKAISTYKKFKELLKPDDKIIPYVDQCIANCGKANSFIADSVSVISKNLGNLINSDLPNINAVVSADGKTLAYTSITKTNNDIFVSNKVNDKWTAPKKITSQVGNKFLLTTFLSFDGKDLYLVSDDPANSDIYVTTFEKNKWIKAIKFGKPINTKANESSACVTKDGNTIYFTSDRKGGLGGYDIYKSTVNEKGTWSDPENLGSSINTEFNEATPYLSPDEKYLFFSSEGHNSMGGYDIFYVNLTGTPKVVNLGYPVNTPDNNTFYCPENNWKSGYISYYDKKGLGQKDIFHVDIERYITLDGKIIAESNTNISNPNTFKVAIVNADKNDTISTINSNDKNFSSKLIAGNYKVVVKNTNFIPFSENLSIPNDYTDREYQFEAHLQPVVVEKPKPIVEVIVPKKEEAKVDTTKTKIKVTKPKENKKPIDNKTKDTKKNLNVTKKEVKDNIEIKVAPKKEIPTIKITKNDSSSSFKVITYSVQLMALTKDIGVDYFKNIANLEITITPENIYRYSVGTTESLEDAMSTLKKVKKLGYTKAFIRIDRVSPTYTIQLMALKKPVEASYFTNLSDVNIVKGDDGFYRYSYGNYSSIDEAESSLQQVKESGYKNAFVKRLVVK